MQKITPCLWFDSQAEEAVEFYTSLIDNSKILNIARYGESGAEASGQQKGKVMTVSFLLGGEEFLALNGGPYFKFSEAVSFIINCETQEELDFYWKRLSEGGEEGQCGWLKDRFGLSWQIVPVVMGDMLSDKDPKRTERVTEAMLKMKKIDINMLQQAYNQQ
jgi:predicted 3-demethylubiquinone-9 3-methyltransferase (glyoxalase superfamily)